MTGYTTAHVNQRAEQLSLCIASLAANLTLWTHRGQLDRLDAYLEKSQWHPQIGTLRQYAPFRDAIAAAALILRVNPADFPAPGEGWGELDGDGEAHMTKFLALTEDVPGPDGSLLPPSAPETRTEDPPVGAAGPGTQDA